MPLSDLLEPADFAADVPAANARAVLRAGARLLARRFARLGTPVDPADLEAALAAREAQASTAFGGGVAFPHARMVLPGLAAAFVRSSEPVPFGAPDGLPVSLFFFLAGPQDDGADQLKALAAATRVLRQEGLVARLSGAADAAALQALLAGARDGRRDGRRDAA